MVNQTHNVIFNETHSHSQNPTYHRNMEELKSGHNRYNLLTV